MGKHPNQPIALKEWSVVIESLAIGEQIILMRKGGIHEETKHFNLEQDSFYLFPTYLHQKKDLLKDKYIPLLDQVLQDWDEATERIKIEYFAEVIEEIKIHDLDILNKLSHLHIWTGNFAEAKLHWKKDNPLHILVVRVYRLESPIMLNNLEEYYGCKSWIQIKDKIENVDYKPVLSDGKFNAQMKLLHEALN